MSLTTSRIALSQIPEVPQLVMPATGQLVATLIVAALAVVAVAVAVVMGRRHGTALYVAVLLGGAVASLNEPIADLLGGCIHPQTGGWQVFSTFDRPIPLWVVLAYGLYLGATPLVVVALTRGANPRRRFQAAIGVIFLSNLLIEMPVLAAGLYAYYGDQAFSVGGFPLYWLFINGAGVAGAAVVVLRFGHFFRGARVGCALVLPMAAQIAAYFVGMPAFSAFNSGAAAPWNWVGAVATMLLGAAVLWGLARLIPEHQAAVSVAVPEVLTPAKVGG